MERRVLTFGARFASVFLVLTLAACSGATPTWTIGPAPSVTAAPSSAPSPSQAAATPSAAASPSAAAAGSPSAAPTPSSTPAPSPSPAPTATPTAAASAAPSPAESSSASPAPPSSAADGPTATPAPPDPGEPGFVAGTTVKPRIVDMAVTDLLLFDPTTVSVAQGETITFRITNTGKAEHEFKVGPMQDVFDDLESAPEVTGITPGSTKTITYTFTGTGPYAFACHAPGHFENGMFGFVNVVPKQPWLGTTTKPRMVVIRMDDHLEFVPSEISATPGETILFVLPNVGANVTHEFQVGPADRVALDQVDGQIVKEADKIEPGHVDFLTYTFGSVGPYAFACHEPGHYEAGMKGIIDLTP